MRIELTQTMNDLISFYQFHHWYSDERKNFRIKTRLSWGIITAIPFALIILNVDSGRVTSTFGLVLYGLFFFSLGFIGIKHLALSNWRGVAIKIANDNDNSEFMGPKTLEFTNDKIAWTSQWGQGQSVVETIKKVKSDNKYYYLYNTSFSAYIIPRTVLKTEDEVNEFESIVKNYGQRAKTL
jgi:hypothetical protein